MVVPTQHKRLFMQVVFHYLQEVVVLVFVQICKNSLRFFWTKTFQLHLQLFFYVVFSTKRFIVMTEYITTVLNNFYGDSELLSYNNGRF